MSELVWLTPPGWLPPPHDGWLGRSAFALTKRTCFKQSARRQFDSGRPSDAMILEDADAFLTGHDQLTAAYPLQREIQGVVADEGRFAGTGGPGKHSQFPAPVSFQ